MAPEEHLNMMDTITTMAKTMAPERWLKVVPQLISIMDMKNVDVPNILLHISRVRTVGLSLKILIFDKNFDFRQKFRFSTEISIFDKKFVFLIKICIFDKILYF